jgi:hypothetical protein
MSLPEHRAGDADREVVAARLREAHVEGRLDVDELTTRLDVVYRAKTYGELAAVTADLPPARKRSRPPGSEPAVAPASSAPARRDAKGLRSAWAAWTAAVLINVVIWVLVSVSAGEAIYFWPMWVAGPWGAVLLAVTLTGGKGRR